MRTLKAHDQKNIKSHESADNHYNNVYDINERMCSFLLVYFYTS
jgi:hypothetical protein